MVGVPGRIEAAENGAHQHLVGGGGGEAGAGQHIGAHIGVKAAEAQVQLVEPGSDAPDEGGGGALLLGDDLQFLQIDALLAMALGVDADDIAVIFGHNRHRVQGDGRRQDPAPLVVGVVTADLTAAGGRVDLHHMLFAKTLSKGVDNMQIPLPLALPAAGVQLSEGLIVCAGVQRLL